MPLHGPEEDFLTTNYGSALKVLDKQISLYTKEPASKDMIVKGMVKLFNKGHAKLLEDLPQETQRLIYGRDGTAAPTDSIIKAYNYIQYWPA